MAEPHLPTECAAPRLPRLSRQRICAIRRWTPVLWSIRIERPANYTFQPGHYARLGLPADTPDAAVWRPYSLVSAPSDSELEFLLVLIPGGAFTSQLAALKEGDALLLEQAVFGFFLETQLAPGDTLWMLATGTGVGPCVSLLRTPGALDRYARAVLVHSVRHTAELACRDEIEAPAAVSNSRLVYVPIVTREPGATALSGRIPRLIADGTLQARVGHTLEPADSRVMVCGNPEFTTEMRALLTERGFTPCRRNSPGSMLFEKYW
ncbi:ferredoxin--NADP reductase [Methyloversatilis sp.]|uniref:ferredoxin--NADP reductase n=1 Tax=Methyloversatilis sp. TaxID=2569862 RepID=UPI0035B41CA9